MKNTAILVMAILALAILASAVEAVPPIPNEIYGTVTINGAAAPDGTTVEAKVLDGTTWKVFGTVTTPCSPANAYCLLVNADDPATPEKEGGIIGDEIKIYINGNLAITSIAPLLFIDQMAIPGGRTVNIGYTSSTCTESWTCGEWSAWGTCTDSSQSRTRTCTDANTCGTTSSRPAITETQTCSSGTGGNTGGGGGGGGSRGITESSEVDTTHNTTTETSSTATPVGENNNEITTDGSGITGAATTFFTATNVGVGIGVIVVAAAGLVLYLRRR